MLTQLDRSPARRSTQLPRYFRWFSGGCVLRQLDSTDVARVWRAAVHPSFARCWTTEAPAAEADVAQRVAAAQAEWMRGGRYVMAASRKQTQEFIGWIDLRTTAARGVWTIDWFVHPRFVADALAGEAITAAADLLFSALDAHSLYGNCPPRNAPFERMLNDAGFIELVPAGSLDHTTGRPRARALYELRRSDWVVVRSARQRDSGPATLGAPSTQPALELALL
jgi:RimJ/RimL family protein N-acetyltransferase